MSIKQAARIQKFLESVNRDIRRELRTASAFISQAEDLDGSPVRFVGVQYLRIGAAAMCNATALAAEVLAVGGNPPIGTENRNRAVPRCTTRQKIRNVARASRHYLCRWRSAQRLGLFRLAGIFREITQSQRHQLEQILLLASEGGVTCPSCLHQCHADLAGPKRKND